MRTVIIHSPGGVDDLREDLEALPGVEVLGLGYTPSTVDELNIGVIVRTTLSDYDLEGYLYIVSPADDAVFSDVPPWA